MFTGTVQSAEKRLNTLTGKPFYYCEIQTLGGLWSAVYAVELFENMPQAGNVIQGDYWITGQLAEAAQPEAPKKRSFWQKLFG